jgi:hypothetical protein
LLAIIKAGELADPNGQPLEVLEAHCPAFKVSERGTALALRS